MPELAEVNHARHLFDVALGHTVSEIITPAPHVRVLRDVDVVALRQALLGQRLISSHALGKQLLFRFGETGDRWLGLHLGMAGRLRVEKANFTPIKHDHLVLKQRHRTLIFHDPRHFGRVRFAWSKDEPTWWSQLPPSILDKAFRAEAVAAFLARRRHAPLKAILLMQERFPGVGNWMADEILWRAGLHPATRAGALPEDAATDLWRVTRQVARRAMAIISDDWDYPKSWLFTHRWEDGGRCPRCRTILVREPIGGRTTCWCPGCQPILPRLNRPALPPRLSV